MNGVIVKYYLNLSEKLCSDLIAKNKIKTLLVTVIRLVEKLGILLTV